MRGRFQGIRRIGLYFMALLLVAGYPYAAMAQTPPETTATEPVVTEQTTTTETPAPTVTVPPEPEHTYTYDPTSQTWSTEEWQYNPLTGVYDAVPKPVVIEPEVKDEATSEAAVDVETNVEVNNNLDSDATSGDAAVASNTTGGNATTGDAAAMATMLTSVNSVIGGAGANQEVAQFTQDIYGDVKGDIMLYPMLLKEMLENEIQDSLKINATTDLEVNNNLDLTATSGDATVTQNTTAGNATTGNATAVANLITILNSMIATQKSFVGTINIYGNLEGDILIAPDFIPQMIAHNGGGDSTTQVSTQDTTTIMNNISTMAESGAAAVMDNTRAGSATSGTADTNVVIFNMTGHDIVAENSLLVFVNVMGQWVGVIVDAPAGATSAMIGNGVTSSSVAPELTIDASTDHTINNNVNVTAISGDAEVSKNTQAGNATTGAAMAAANIANISGSQMSLSGWFGVLFINVFQNWYGSFGVNTAYGDKEAKNEAGPGGSPGVIQFVPHEETIEGTSNNVVPLTLVDSRFIAEEPADEEVPVATLLSATSGGKPAAPVATQPETIAQDYRLWVIAASIILMGVSAVGLRRLFFGKAGGIA